MARPPLAAPAPNAVDAAPTAEADTATPADVMGEGEGDGGWQPFVTVMKNADGQFMLVDGDEPEPEEGGEPQGPVFEDGPNLLKALMDKIEGGQKAAADDAFEEGYRGGPKKAPMAPMA